MIDARRTVIAWDTETFLIRAGVHAPEVVCLQWMSSFHATNEHPSTWQAYVEPVTDSTLEMVHRWLLDPTIHLVGHHVAFDMCVMMQRDPSLIPLVFRAYEENRVTDTKLRQQLLDIAAGKHRKEFRGGICIRHDYDLGALTKRNAGWQISKPKKGKDVTPEDAEHWRLRYGELYGLPLEAWPAPAVNYALDDARATMAVYLAQEVHADVLEDQYRQARRFLALTLASAWGLRTRADGVEVFASEVDGRLEEVKAELVKIGLVRPDGTRNVKAAARLMVQICREKNLEIVPTDKAEKAIKAGEGWDFDSGTGVALDADTCERVEDPRMELYAEFGTLGAVKAKDLPMLLAGEFHPIHTRFDIVDTGRTSSSKPNVQNLRTLKGIRECFVPRAGWVYLQADYPGLELKTLAQVCIWFFGDSALGRAINQGLDPHLMLAANIDHCDYDEAKARYKANKNWRPRQAAKVANFGFPGGLGYASFVEYARASYGVTVTEDESKQLKKYWLQTWPEMKRYFGYVSDMCNDDEGRAEIVAHPGSNRLRGKVRYTAACNGFFQGLGADATSAALWAIAKAMYVEKASPLYGSRTVNFVHDELIAEHHVTDGIEAVCVSCKGGPTPKPCDSCSGTGRGWTSIRASLAVYEMCELMRKSANQWLPDVPFPEGSIEPVLMSHWSKDAKTLIDGQGLVQVWRGL